MKARQGLCKLSKGIQAALKYLGVAKVRVDIGLRQTPTETSAFVSVDAEDQQGHSKSTTLTPV